MEERKRCKKCNSTMVYLRLKTNEFVCRSCGHIEKMKGGIKKE